MTHDDITDRALSHLEREHEVQGATKAARVLSLADLRLVRAELADLLERDIPPIARERATLRGEVIHGLIGHLESGMGNTGRFLRQLTQATSGARASLVDIPELNGAGGKLRGGGMQFDDAGTDITACWYRRKSSYLGVIKVKGEIVARVSWDQQPVRQSDLRCEIVMEGGGCCATTLFRRLDGTSGWWAWRCRFEHAGSNNGR